MWWKRVYISLLFFSIFCGCGTDAEEENEKKLAQGQWRATLASVDGELPFNFNLVYYEDTLFSIAIINGEEVIELKDITFRNDSIIIRFPVYDSEIRAYIVDEKTMEGAWYDYNRPDNYHLKFHAVHGVAYRFFEDLAPPANDISGKWETWFSPGEDDEWKAEARFTQKNGMLTGTFLTATGDFRYLDGVVTGDSLYLSTFDGAHAYLFRASIGDTIKGIYFSGDHYQEQWIAVRNEKFILPDPDTLTYLKKGYENIQFQFPDTDSNMVSLNDPKYQGKVKVVQIMGTWCPNCKDETAFLADHYKRNKDKDLEIISIAFERTDDFQKAKRNVERMKEEYDIDYEVLIAGVANKQKVGEAFPMLNQFIAYPTTIFIDRNDSIRRIHTGFSGPATGADHEKFIREFDLLVQQMLNEDSATAKE